MKKNKSHISVTSLNLNRIFMGIRYVSVNFQSNFTRDARVNLVLQQIFTENCLAKKMYRR